MGDGIRSGRHDAAIIAVLIRVAEGLARGRLPSESLRAGGVALPAADLAVADRMARATAADVARLVARWRTFGPAEKHAYMARVLAAWKVKRGSAD